MLDKNEYLNNFFIAIIKEAHERYFEKVSSMIKAMFFVTEFLFQYSKRSTEKGKEYKFYSFILVNK